MSDDHEAHVEAHLRALEDRTRRSVWTRWRDEDPRSYAFNVRLLWTRVWHGKRWSVDVVRVRWEANPGRLVPLPFEPPELRRRVEEGDGWWAFVSEPAEPPR